MIILSSACMKHTDKERSTTQPITFLPEMNAYPAIDDASLTSKARQETLTKLIKTMIISSICQYRMPILPKLHNQAIKTRLPMKFLNACSH